MPPEKRASAGAVLTKQENIVKRLVDRYITFATGILVLVLVLVFVPSNKTDTARVANTAGITPATSPGAPGETVSGVSCGPGKLQIPWSVYSPICEPKWSGNNGGSTYNGVTKTTIRLTYREASSTVLNALYMVIPKTVIGTNQNAETTLNAYISLFNKEFELYGRHVQLVPYVGSGNFISEDTGGGLVQANADATNVASSLHGFADMSLVDASAAYAQDLALKKVVSLSIYENSQDYYQLNAPYAYTPGPNCTEQANADAAILAKTVYGLPATDAGPGTVGKPGKIGILYQDTPQWTTCANQTASLLENTYKEQTPVMQSYAFDLSQFATESATIMAKFKQAGVTTVLCVDCDPVSPFYLFGAADNAQYYPQWFYAGLFSYAFTGGDGYGHLYPAEQTDHMISLGEPVPSNKLQQEALQAYLKTGAPLSQLNPSYYFIYMSLLQFYSILQSAGPDLTPQTFEQGAFNYRNDLTTSASNGIFGQWTWQSGKFDPANGFAIMHWNPNAISNMNGTKGAFVACNNDTQYQYSNSANSLPNHKPLNCPG